VRSGAGGFRCLVEDEVVQYRGTVSGIGGCVAYTKWGFRCKVRFYPFQPHYASDRCLHRKQLLRRCPFLSFDTRSLFSFPAFLDVWYSEVIPRPYQYPTMTCPVVAVSRPLTRFAIKWHPSVCCAVMFISFTLLICTLAWWSIVRVCKAIKLEIRNCEYISRPSCGFCH
jgi:hypothetical protein